MSLVSAPVHAALEEDRYSRLSLIPWWDQSKISAARILVVGAGALGNEILKNLALLGAKNVVVVDIDRIERSNLSRAVLFRDDHVGRYKADVAAESFRGICAGAEVQPLNANIVHECGLGIFAWSDLILAGLDNREARIWINRAAWKMNRPWIDGAIEGINGVARVFLPGAAPCYECTLGETDWALLERRMSCNLLLRESNAEGKVPTTPTISSIIAGIEVQEAVKLIHGLPTLASRGFIFEGLSHSSYVVEYTSSPDCISHYTLGEIIELPLRSSEISLADLHDRAKADLGDDNVVVEFSREIIASLRCPECNTEEFVFAPVGTVSFDEGKCPNDGRIRAVNVVHSYTGAEAIGNRQLSAFGLPLFDVFTARSADREIGYLIAGDSPDVLGRLAKQDGR
jgi:molybdopterin/thiamine biosynthesis adenylyltransferase